MIIYVCVCLSLMSHQYLKSYGDGTRRLSLIQQTEEARDREQPLLYKVNGLPTTPQGLICPCCEIVEKHYCSFFPCSSVDAFKIFVPAISWVRFGIMSYSITG